MRAPRLASIARGGLVATVLAGLACAPGERAPAGRESGGDTLVVGATPFVDSWNPYTAREAFSAALLEWLYPRLVRERLGAGDERFEPWLAERWEFSADRLDLTFHLRRDAVWSDGSPITCDDVRFTWRAQVSEGLAWAGADLKDRIEEVSCPDPHTARFRFREAYPDQLLDANDDAIVPAAYGDIPFERWRATRWQDRLVTSGPFRLETLAADQDAILVRDPNWWGADEVGLERVVVRAFAKVGPAVTQLLGGRLDIVPKVPPRRAREVEQAPGVTLVTSPSFRYAFLAWNLLEPGAYRADRARRGCLASAPCGETVADLERLLAAAPHPVLSDARVRRALTLAIDRQGLVEGLWEGRARVAGSPIVSVLWAHDPSVVLPYDPAAASRLLDEAGWSERAPDGVRTSGGRRLELSVLVNAENTTRRAALDRIAAALRPLGVRIVPEPLPLEEFVDRARDKAFDGLLGGWRAGTRVEPQAVLGAAAAIERGNNLGAWIDPIAEEAVAAARAAPDRTSALPAWRRWQARFAEQQPYTMLYEESELVGVRDEVRGLAPSPINPLDGLWRTRRVR